MLISGFSTDGFEQTADDLGGGSLIREVRFTTIATPRRWLAIAAAMAAVAAVSVVPSSQAQGAKRLGVSLPDQPVRPRATGRLVTVRTVSQLRQALMRLRNGDRVVVEKFRYGLFLPLRDHAELSWNNPSPGDVVVLRSPADGVDIIKRVIGVPGDQIELRDEEVYRNGKIVPTKQVGKCTSGTGALQPGCRVYESQVNEHSFRFSTAFRMFEPFSERVPEGHIYVLGDHRDHSNDSRNPAIGMVPVSAVKGRALMIYWSSGEQGTRFDRTFHQVQ